MVWCVKLYLLTRITHHTEDHITSHCITYGYIAPLPLQYDKHHTTALSQPPQPPLAKRAPR